MTLAEEAQRYLAVVELFRAEGYEPHWQAEWLVPPEAPRCAAQPKRLRVDRTKQRRK